MAILLILQYPDSRLHRVAVPVTAVDEAISLLIKNMAETMYAAPGIGLAATQVDALWRIVVIDNSATHDQLRVFINPEIVARSGVSDFEEGCLSVPGIYDGVIRHDAVHVHALDAQGQGRVIEAQELLAVCIQHEMDHLMGKVFVEYLSPLKRNRIKTKMLKAQREDTR